MNSSCSAISGVGFELNTKPLSFRLDPKPLSGIEKVGPKPLSGIEEVGSHEQLQRDFRLDFKLRHFAAV